MAVAAPLPRQVLHQAPAVTGSWTKRVSRSWRSGALSGSVPGTLGSGRATAFLRSTPRYCCLLVCDYRPMAGHLQAMSQTLCSLPWCAMPVRRLMPVKQDRGGQLSPPFSCLCTRIGFCGVRERSDQMTRWFSPRVLSAHQHWRKIFCRGSTPHPPARRQVRGGKRGLWRSGVLPGSPRWKWPISPEHRLSARSSDVPRGSAGGSWQPHVPKSPFCIAGTCPQTRTEGTEHRAWIQDSQPAGASPPTSGRNCPRDSLEALCCLYQ